MKKVLEICCEDIHSVLSAQAGGANRIELCAHLGAGGITPSGGLIQLAVEQSQLPVFVLIRPRPGNFCYSELEFENLLCDIRLARNLGAASIVSGVLQEDGTIDLHRTRQMIDLARPLPFTFHRAFDACTDPLASLEDLIDIGVDRILTSGQAPTASQGSALLRKLHQKAEGRLQIMAGGGVRPHNLGQLLKDTGLSEFHSSAQDKATGSAGVSQQLTRKMRQLLDQAENG